MANGTNIVTAKSGPNVYTVLIMIATLALLISIGFCYKTLTSPPPQGYGMQPADFFKPLAEQTPVVESKVAETTDLDAGQ